MNHFGEYMSDAIDFDHKIANMPQIRVVKNHPKNRNSFLSVPIRVRDINQSTYQNRPYFNQSTAMDSSTSRNSRQHSTQPSQMVKNYSQGVRNNSNTMIVKR